MDGLINQINAEYYYDPFTLDDLSKVAKNIMAKSKDELSWCFFAINRITYSGNNLQEVRYNKFNALKQAKMLIDIQGFKPRVKFIKKIKKWKH